MTSRIIRLPEVITHTGLSRSTIYARIAEDQFPRPVSLGGRLVGWHESDIQQWIEERESTATSKAKEA
ncbi:MAG: helix-turn-helix transcriptional regulator [Thalassolituus sp.]